MPDPLPHVISLCGTFLKPEMQSIYRQVTGLKRVRTTVYTQSHENAEMFPFEPVVTLKKLPRPRLKGNFLLRFWFKHVIKSWPPPFPINKEVSPYYPYDLVELLKADKPDLVHVYYGHKAVHYLDMLEAWGGPFVVSFHGVDVSKFLDQPEYVAKLKTVFKKANLVMARSQSLLDRLEELGCPADKLRMNHTPIPLEHLQAEVRQPPKDGQWRLVQACRLIQKKGILTTLKALAIVKQKHPLVRYVLCGEGPLKPKIEETVHKLGLEDNVEMLGWLDQQQLLEQYRIAQMFLHPSQKTKEEDQEGIPNSMLEAMATGLPVVATMHGGIPEAVHSGEDGLLVPEKNPEELAQAILKIMETPSELARLSQNAAASVRENFGSETQVAAMEDVYLSAICLHATHGKTSVCCP
ncbi:glycosyltransferase involved in cell wall biosynthesis [Roseimicrobium gellanilyticum]|uniref:Glycosyltransferase involved in cell wall biosynthesis n=1 Tax=Roseimicrobium gellanilyticum TaxID=748857 RepID=A0A366HRQ8_9BACT|nr:glycosyltransferase [Roseimicrobium gellanilyticum]RBP45939.1 glycosyltransferase involved in cell wall biosynthesis [Roseimicrobium gellanilyticum]